MITHTFRALLLSAVFLGTACTADSATDATVGKQDQNEQSTAAQTRGDVVTATQSLEVKPDVYSAPDDAWRDVDPENLLYIDTNRGLMVVELYPEIAPAHVAQIKTLARSKFYDFITFHRVIEGFMNQTGDPKGDGTGNSDLPDLKAEFTFRRSPDMPLTLIGARKVDPNNNGGGELGVGFYKALPVASHPAAQAMMTVDGKVEAMGLHCKGVTSMARSQIPDSANSQFFIMRDTASHLNATYSIWGSTVWGRENITKITVGSKGEDPTFVPDEMKTVRVGTDVPDGERLDIQVLKTTSPAFKNYLKTLKDPSGQYPDVCDIEIPTRLKP